MDGFAPPGQAIPDQLCAVPRENRGGEEVAPAGLDTDEGGGWREGKWIGEGVVAELQEMAQGGGAQGRATVGARGEEGRRHQGGKWRRAWASMEEEKLTWADDGGEWVVKKPGDVSPLQRGEVHVAAVL